VRVVLLGPPGSGKGTQGELLARQYQVPHVSSGDLMRDHVGQRTELGQQVARYLDNGDLVPDDLVLAVMGRAVREAIDEGGYVLDGFPRTLAQAEQAYALAEPAGATADAVVYLSVPDDVARERLAGRASAGRSDDGDADVIERRLRVFHQQTEPLLEFYRERGILVTADATEPPDVVADDIRRALEDRNLLPRPR